MEELDLVNLIKEFANTLKFKYNVNKLKIGLPKEIANKFHKELIKKYEDIYFVIPSQKTDNSIREFSVPENITLILEVLE